MEQDGSYPEVGGVGLENEWLAGCCSFGGELILLLGSWVDFALAAFTRLLVWTTEAGCGIVGSVVPGIFPTITLYNGFSMHTASVTPVKYGVSMNNEDLSNWGSTNGSINEGAVCYLTSKLRF